MSDEASLRCTDRKVFNIVIANAEIREPVHPYQMQWMSHWSQASSSSSFQSHKHHSFGNVMKNQILERRCLPVDTNTTYDLEKHDSTSYLLPASSMNLEDFTLYRFQNSTGLSSEQTHFPMIEINRRMQSIVAPKKKISFDTMKAKMNEQALPLSGTSMAHRSTQFASEGHRCRQDITGSSRTRLENGSCSHSDNVPPPFLTEERSTQRDRAFGRNRSVVALSEPNKMLNCLVIGCRKRKSQKFSNATQYLLIKKEVGANSCHNDKTVEGSSVSAKGRALFEKLTVPAMLYNYGQREEKLQTLVSPANDIEAVDHTDAQFMMKEEENLAETDIMHIDVNERQSFPEVGNSSESCKVHIFPTTKTYKVEDSNSSRTECMDALSKKPSNPPAESTERDSDRNMKWVKRLRPSLLDSIPLSTKRFKKGGSSSIEMQNLLSRVVSYDRTISELSGPFRDREKETPWIRRWCKGSTSKGETASPKVTPLLFENFEGRQFPSLAAMALMGKQVTNYHPCEFRKRGSTTIWNI